MKRFTIIITTACTLIWLALLIWIGALARKDATFGSSIVENLAATAIEATILVIIIPLVLRARDLFQAWEKRQIFAFACFRASDQVLDAALELAGVDALTGIEYPSQIDGDALRRAQPYKIENLNRKIDEEPILTVSIDRWDRFISKLDEAAANLSRVLSMSKEPATHRILWENLECLIILVRGGTFHNQFTRERVSLRELSVHAYVFEMVVKYAEQVDSALEAEWRELGVVKVTRQWEGQPNWSLFHQIRCYLWGRRLTREARRWRERDGRNRKTS